MTAVAVPICCSQCVSLVKQGVDKRYLQTPYWLLRPWNYTLLAACAPSETAAEVKHGDGRWNGILTRTLFEVLADVGPNGPNGSNASLGRVHRQLSSRIHVNWPQQTPALLGNTDARFLGTEGQDVEQEKSCGVVLLSDKEIRLQHGRLHGVLYQ